MDAMELLKQIPDNSVDLVLTDPPYGINADKMQMGSGIHHWEKDTKDWDEYIPDKTLFNEIFRISKNQIIWGGNYFTKYLPPTKNWLIWDKLNPNMSFSEAELAWVGNGKRIRIFKNYSANKLKLHPTEKPLALMDWCLVNYSKENDIICDPFMGSWTTAVACQKLHRQFIGCDLEQKYCKIGEERLRQEVLL